LQDTADKPLENLEEKEENWMSFGYSLVDRDEDEWAHHLMMFSSISCMIFFFSLFFGYFPDIKNNAWAQREAYLELARREKEGLPLVDANVIDPAKINLPSDEELGDFEIII
jgi:NADH dehydrogenase (ubiquinone) 1 beta subcomplex subunit 11